MFPVVYALFFFVSKLSFVHRLHEAQTSSRSTNGSYAWSTNSNHVTLNTMPSIIVDIDMKSRDLYWLSLTSVLLILNGSPLFLLTDVYLLIIVFSEQGRLRMASVSVWPSDAVPCLYAATLHMVFRILATLPRCWFGCVVSQADWLLNINSPSDIQ